MSAIACCYLGKPDEALEHLAKMWRPSPFDPLNNFFGGVAGYAEFIAGRYDRAIELLEKGRHGSPARWPASAITSLAWWSWANR